MGAISLLFRPGTHSAGGLISPLFSPAFGHTFDHLQLNRATLIFKMQKDLIYIIISKNNIRYLLWNRGAWCFFHDTYLTIEVQGIRCTNHLHDSCPFTDVNPHFTAPGCRYYFKINSWYGLSWRHRHMGQPLAIVTSQWSIVPTGIYGCMNIFVYFPLHFRTPVFQHGA